MSAGVSYEEWKEKYVPKEEQNSLDKSAESGIIKESDIFRSIADPLVEALGAAEDSHPKEVESILNYLRSNSVEIVIDEHSAIGYSPGLSAGEHGQFIVPKGASISAWRHELQHVKDNESMGWLTFNELIYGNKERRISMEEKAYAAEIDLAKALGRDDMVARLETLLQEERKRINELYGDSQRLIP